MTKNEEKLDTLKSLAPIRIQRFRLTIWHTSCDQVSGAAVNKCGCCSFSSAAQDRIAFPVAVLGTGIRSLWPLLDRFLPMQSSTSFFCMR